MKKRVRSQVTIFIIIGIFIILIAVTAGLFLIKDNRVVRQFINRNSVSSEVMPVYEFFNDCGNQRAIDAIRIVGLQGGYVDLPKNYIITKFSSVSYGYYLGKNTLPSKQMIQNEISSYIHATVPFCIENESLHDFKVNVREISVNTTINLKDVQVSLFIPISATKDNKTYKLDEFYYYEIPSRLGDMLNVANNIVNREVKDPKNIPLSYMADTDYNVLSMSADNDTIVYAIVDVSNKSTPGGIGYSFVFANKFE